MNWTAWLSRALSRLPDGRLPRLSVVGVGQTLRGDDGAGPAIARRLAAQLADPALQVMDAGHAPENCLGRIVSHRPDVILFMDAIRGDGAPGDIIWLPAEASDSVGGSTHTLSLAMLGCYLAAETGAAVFVLGIVPAHLGFGEGLSPAVAAAVERVAETLTIYWRKEAAASSARITGDVSVVSA